MITLIILDWDDTLFPSSWVIKNNINLFDSNNESKLRYVRLFSELDKILYGLLKKFKKYGKVIIITNALLSWVSDCMSVLPKTSQLLHSLRIISARQLFQYHYPDMMEWKKNTFKHIVNENINTNTNINGVMNIISIGDAEYEYKALIDLYTFKKNKKILKSIKFLRNPTLNILLDQLTVLYKAIDNICTDKKHIDWNFKFIQINK